MTEGREAFVTCNGGQRVWVPLQFVMDSETLLPLVGDQDPVEIDMSSQNVRARYLVGLIGLDYCKWAQQRMLFLTKNKRPEGADEMYLADLNGQHDWELLCAKPPLDAHDMSEMLRLVTFLGNNTSMSGGCSRMLLSLANTNHHVLIVNNAQK